MDYRRFVHPLLFFLSGHFRRLGAELIFSVVLGAKIIPIAVIGATIGLLGATVSIGLLSIYYL